MTAVTPNPSSEPYRVLQIIEATTGGTRRHLHYLLTNLDPSRFSLSLIYSNKRDLHFEKDLEEFRNRGVELFEVPMRREISPWRDFLAFVKIAHIIRHGRFDLVHAHSSKAGFIGRLAAKLFRVPAIVYSPHSFAFQYCPASLRGRFYRILEKFAAFFHHKLLAVSEGERQAAIESGICSPKKIETIPNAIPLDTNSTAENPIEIKKSLGIGDDELILGMVAQFRPQKGLRHFVDAIPLVLAIIPKVRFLIIGDGPLFQETEDHIRELGVGKSVTLAGHRENINDYYQIMDLFVLSSLWEGMPYAILEAMAAGLPVVATDIAGNRELVVDGKNGFLTSPESSEKIASCINRLLEDDNLRLSFGQESSNLSKRRISFQEWVERYEKFYLSLLQDKDPKRNSTTTLDKHK